MRTKQYDQRIDIAKGIGMILLVMGHLLNIDTPGFKVIFAFHMPLFFFLSGYLFNGFKYCARDFFGIKISKLVWAYLFFVSVGTMFCLVHRDLGGAKRFVYTTFFYGQPSVNNNLWFLTTLILVTSIYYFLPKLSSVKNYQFCMVIIICMILSYIFDYIPQKYIPLKLNTLPLAFLFFACGNRIDSLNSLIGRPSKLINFGLALIVLLICSQLNSRVDLRLNMAGNPVLFLMGGISGIWLVLSVADKVNSVILAEIGRSSLLFFPIEGHIRVLVNDIFNHINHSEYLTNVDLPIKYAIVEFPISVATLILIIRYCYPAFSKFLNIINQHAYGLMRNFNHLNK